MNVLNTKTINLFILSTLILIGFSPITVSAFVCTSLLSDFGASTRSNDVLALQRFLSSSDYLSATPNGYFGQATLSALKQFQSVNGLSSTGYVGPLTRALIQKISCVTTSIPQNTLNVPSKPSVSVQTPSPVSDVIFTSPRSGSTLVFGQSATIKWNGGLDSNMALVLEDESGVAKGFISAYPNQNQYVWEVGKLSVSGSDLMELVEPGNYRIRLQGRNSGPIQSDIKSELFKIQAPEIVVKSVMPASVSADNKSVVVLYGSGFFGKTKVRLNDMYGEPVSVLYTSSDGTVIIFSIPSGISSGTYQISLTNKYGISATGQAMITVRNP
jgi:peptidoglycan hydrolase-like protein with peptidoglycan-binding domain